MNMLSAFNQNLMETISDELADQGYAVIDQAFSAEFVDELRDQIQTIDASQFKSAGIGRAGDFQTNKQIRSDQIKWLDERKSENQIYFNWAEELRTVLNQQFYLGLSEYECMFAQYPKGAYYKKHLDAFKPSVHQRSNNRKISTILYLNADWQAEDGGELLMYKSDQKQPFVRILPEPGKLVVFLSEDFPHEVLPAKKLRYSLTGWFRVKA